MKKRYKIIIGTVLAVLIAFTFFFLNIKFGTDASKKALEGVSEVKQTDVSERVDSKKAEYNKLKKLKKLNKDTVAIIKIDKTDIYYPVMQSKDNKDYLRKNINGNFDLNGSIFMDYECRFDKSDNTILYGHNMESENMFSDLVKYNNRDFYEKHRDIYLYGENKEIKYRVIGVYSLDVTKESTYDFNIYVKNDARTNPVKYIENLKPHMVFFDKNAKIDSNSRFLTLSTCSDTAGQYRTVVVAEKIAN